MTIVYIIILTAAVLAWLVEAISKRRLQRKVNDVERRLVAQIEVVDKLKEDAFLLERQRERSKREALEKNISDVLKRGQEESQERAKYTTEQFRREITQESLAPLLSAVADVDSGIKVKGEEPPKGEPPAKNDLWQNRIGRILEDENNEVQEITPNDDDPDSAPQIIKIGGKLYTKQDDSPAKKIAQQKTDRMIDDYWKRAFALNPNRNKES